MVKITNAEDLYHWLLGEIGEYVDTVGQQPGIRFAGAPVEQTLVIQGTGFEGDFIRLKGNLLDGTKDATFMFHWTQCNFLLVKLEPKYSVSKI